MAGCCTAWVRMSRRFGLRWAMASIGLRVRCGCGLLCGGFRNRGSWVSGIGVEKADSRHTFDSPLPPPPGGLVLAPSSPSINLTPSSMGEMVPSWNRCRLLLRRCAVSFLPSVSLHGPGMVGGEGLRRRLVSALAPAMSVFCRCSRRCQVRCGVPWMLFDESLMWVEGGPFVPASTRPDWGINSSAHSGLPRQVFSCLVSTHIGLPTGHPLSMVLLAGSSSWLSLLWLPF